MANTLYEYYTGKGQALPSLSSRSTLYQQYGLGDATTYAGTAEQNTALLSKLQGTQQIAQPAIPSVAPPPTTISSATVAPTQIPTLPTPTAPTFQETLQKSIAEQVDQARTQLDAQYKAQAESAQKAQTELQKRIDEITRKEEGAIGEVSTLTQPFREQMETSERERLYINENFQANQTLTRELESLLQEGNDLIAIQRGRPIASSVQARLVNKTIEDVQARSSVIQAVFSARNGQIAQAERMIDRGVEAITADRRDRLNYFETLINFYEGQRGEKKTELAGLKKDEKAALENQISLIKGDLERAQTYANDIKKAITDPDKAQAYAQAGVKLTDSPEEISSKLAKYGYQKEVAKLSNDMAEKGYTYLAPGQSAPAGAEVVTTTDSKGVTKQYYKVKTKTPKETEPLSILDIQRYQELYPEAGVVAGDTEAQANAKAAAISTPEAKTRALIVAAQANGADYETVVKEIQNDTTITDKDTAIKIAKEVYGEEAGGKKEGGIFAEGAIFGTGGLVDNVHNFLFGIKR